MGGRVDLQGKREDPSRPKGKRESGGERDVLSSFPPYYQAARTHDRTETEIDFPVGLTPPTFDTPDMLIIIEEDLLIHRGDT